MSDFPPKLLVAIVGPTAVGKTTLAIEIATRLGGEIISADSRQIYKHMDIGTAKPSREELSLVPHHLIDIRMPDERITLAEYQTLANAIIGETHNRNKIPLLVGGTGQYVKAVVEGWTIPHVPPNETIRRDLQKHAEEIGHEALHGELALVDFRAANGIDSRNVRRVIRALEVYYITGKPISELQGRRYPPYKIICVGLTRRRANLYEMVDRRIGAMIETGLVDEVRWLIDNGYDWSLPAMTGVGYKQFERYFGGDATLDETIAQIKRDTRTFVRMQYNWFKLGDNAINWLDLSEITASEAVKQLVRMLTSGSAD